ncbi:KilA-N domain-containing protein [Salmonella enterica]|nr:KilA-N domain-containing protein [Salmonella enterica]
MKFEVNGFDIRVDADGYLSAGDLRKASGRTDHSSHFSQWTRSDTAQKLSVQICTHKNISSAFKQLGGRAGTWLIPEMAWGYCEYLSSEFHLAVLSSFDSAVNGDGKKAVKKAQSVARSNGEFIRELETGIPVLKIKRGRGPSFWIRSAEVQEMIENLEPQNRGTRSLLEAGQPATKSTKEFLIPGNPGFKTKAGRYGGTWAPEQAVYHYASWIDIIHQF